MSQNLKYEIVKKLEVFKVIKKEGWGFVSSRDYRNIIRKAIEKNRLGTVINL